MLMVENRKDFGMKSKRKKNLAHSIDFWRETQIWANNIRNAGHIRIHPIINRAITTVKVYSDTYGEVIIENYF